MKMLNEQINKEINENNKQAVLASRSFRKALRFFPWALLFRQ